MKKITVTVALLIMALCINALAQNKGTIKGIIRDEKTSETLIGTTVALKGSGIGTVTDGSGGFMLPYSGEYPVTLIISYLGYNTKEFVLDSNKDVLLFLQPSTAAMREVVVSARRRKEVAQEIAIPISVLGAPQIENSVSFNVNRVKELVPSVQLYSSNPRNTTLNIRGLGSTFGLTNDGLDPGVGFYVDGVYYSRAAATAIDFIDIEQIEVMRGPQGTLFGKNTTAGNFNITTRKPEHRFLSTFELSYGNFNFLQSKGSVTGSLLKDKIAARFSFTGTRRDGLIYNQRYGEHTNTLNNIGVRTQFLFTPSKSVELLLAADHTQQRPDGYAQVYAGEVVTLRKPYRQFGNIIKDLDYSLPSLNAFDRLIDHDTPWRSDQDFGGVSLNADIKWKGGTLTSTTAWRYWKWGPSNDRDFTGLQALALSQAPSLHQQWSQEFRYARDFSSRLGGVTGLYFFGQSLRPDGAHVEECGKDQWRFVQNSENPLWQTPGLLDGYGIRSYPNLNTLSAAWFLQTDWKVVEKVKISPGIRLNYDKKSVDFKRETYGGLQTTNTQLIALQQSVYSNQAFTAEIDNNNISGQLSAIWSISTRFRLIGNAAISYKPVGINLGGLPVIDGKPMIDLASVKPEKVQHYELGVKSEPLEGLVVNTAVFQTEIHDYQTLVQSPDLSVNRGYLANAEKVAVKGFEVDCNYRWSQSFTATMAVSYTDGRYVRFTNAPVPLEETGGKSFKDISGGRLPGISLWATSTSLEYTLKGTLLKRKGFFFIAGEHYYRSDFSSSPSPSAFLNIDAYSLVNARLGFRDISRFSIFVWSRNILDQEYYEQLLPGVGNAGQFAGVLGDQRTYGITIRLNVL